MAEVMDESPLTVRRSEFEGQDGTFMMKIRPELEWDKEAFQRLVTAMEAYCEQQAGRWQTPPGNETVPRWIAHLFWFIPRFVRDWTTHPDFPRPYSATYYEAAYQRLDDLAWWFFFGKPPYEEGKRLGPLEAWSMDDDVILPELRMAIAQLWEDGCPVASPDGSAGQEETARVALRRWRSLQRRRGTKPLSRERRVDDLAKGLRDVFESDRHVVGPLMQDYRHLAGVLLSVLDSSEGNPRE